ncbi:MAG TPA: hypothetical protein ENI90_02115 [Methylothermaceae bacterium]|nr:hypothetical protein [Methylothermaceae bacterium]
MLQLCRIWLWLLAALPLTLAAEPVRYHWGRGLSLPDQKLLVGGYFNFTYENLRSGIDHASLDDLSLFLTWTPHPRVRLFSELEMEDLVTIRKDDIDSDRHFFSVERLYLDYFAGQNWRLRLGKFLTPVGRWNVIHAAPLVWTTSRPLVTEHLFAPHVSGFMATGSFGDVELSGYFDASEALDPKRNPEAFRSGGGLYLNYEPTTDLHLGLSYLHFKMARPSFQPDTDLFGADFQWRWRRLEVSGEFAYRRPNNARRQERGLYLQAVFPLGHQVFAVGRYEFLQGTHFLESGPLHGTTHVEIAGIAWRPAPPLVLKLEYRFGQRNHRIAPSGLLMSVAMLF